MSDPGNTLTFRSFGKYSAPRSSTELTHRGYLANGFFASLGKMEFTDLSIIFTDGPDPPGGGEILGSSRNSAEKIVQVVRCHKMVVSTCSPVIHQFLLEHLESCGENGNRDKIFIHRQAISPVHFNYLIDFMYRGEVTIRREEFQGFHDCATKLEVNLLLREIERQLDTILDNTKALNLVDIKMEVEDNCNEQEGTPPTSDPQEHLRWIPNLPPNQPIQYIPPETPAALLLLSRTSSKVARKPVSKTAILSKNSLEEAISSALEAVIQNKMTYSTASKFFQVPRTTLYARMHKLKRSCSESPATPKTIGSPPAVGMCPGGLSRSRKVTPSATSQVPGDGPEHLKTNAKEKITEAMQLVFENKMNTFQAAKFTGVPKSTLYSRLNNPVAAKLDLSPSSNVRNAKMTEAMDLVLQNKMNISQAAKFVGVPLSTLSGRLRRLRRRNATEGLL